MRYRDTERYRERERRWVGREPVRGVRECWVWERHEDRERDKGLREVRERDTKG
jgi:hypothetical protein